MYKQFAVVGTKKYWRVCLTHLIIGNVTTKH